MDETRAKTKPLSGIHRVTLPSGEQLEMQTEWPTIDDISGVPTPIEVERKHARSRDKELDIREESQLPSTGIEQIDEAMEVTQGSYDDQEDKVLMAVLPVFRELARGEKLQPISEVLAEYRARKQQLLAEDKANGGNENSPA